MATVMEETTRRREKQKIYNVEHGITPETIRKGISDILQSVFEKADHVTVKTGAEDMPNLAGKELKMHISRIEKKMKQVATNLEFEEAARLRDEIRKLEQAELQLSTK